MPPESGSAPIIVPPPTQPPVAPSVLYTPASAGRRLANYCVDVIGIYLWSVGLGLIVTLFAPDTGVLPFFLGILGAPTYYMFFEGIWQRSPGKYVTRTKVVAIDGSKPDLAHIIGRSLARLVPFEPFSFLFSSHPVGWHDRWTSTFVVSKDYTPDQVRMIDPSHVKRSSSAILIAIVATAVVVIVVIGVLASIILASLNVAQTKGRDAARLADIQELQLGLDLYHGANNAYPTSLDQLVPTDISVLPQDPSGGSYDYYSCTPSTYHLGTSLEDQTNPALTAGAQQPPMCAQDPIQGSPATKCTPTDAGSYCYDVDQNSSTRGANDTQ